MKKATADELPPFSPKANDLFDSATSGDLTSFYYFASGEEQTLLRLFNEVSYDSRNKRIKQLISDDDSWMTKGSKEKNKKGGDSEQRKKHNLTNGGKKLNDTDVIDSHVQPIEKIEHALYELNEAVRVSTTICLSGYHPPPAHRAVLGDLAYLVVTFPDGSVVHVTACPIGFYMNRSSATKFDPTPALKVGKNNYHDACYSHTLLDCLLQSSTSLCRAWRSALTAAKKRSDLLHQLSLAEDTLYNLFRPAASSFPNNASGPAANAPVGGISGMLLPVSSPSTFTPRMDALVVRPTWLVSLPSVLDGDLIGSRLSTWDHDKLHSWDTYRAEEELTSVYGMDIRGGGLRDWNEELQTARELPVETIGERTERARSVHFCEVFIEMHLSVRIRTQSLCAAFAGWCIKCCVTLAMLRSAV
jgi:protein TIF31